MSDIKKTIDLLQQVKVKLQQGWTQGVLARNMFGLCVPPHSPSANCFCLSGALISCIDKKDWLNPCYLPEYFKDARHAIQQTINPDNSDSMSSWELTRFNDNSSRTQQEVIEMLDKTIARLQSEAKPISDVETSPGVILAMAGGNSLARFGSNDPSE